MTQTYVIDDIKAVILMGGRDFGRCPTASRLNRALWPVAGKPVLQHLIEHIANQGIRRFVVCCENSARQTRQLLQLPSYLDVHFIEETMPRGTAGCIRDAIEPERDKLLFVFQACTLTPPDIHELIESHRRAHSAMTVFFNTSFAADGEALYDAQLYICEPVVWEHIPQKGYFDLKEGLVPALVAADKTIQAVHLKNAPGTFMQWRQYLCAASGFLEKISDASFPLREVQPLKDHKDIWIGSDVHIDDTVRLYGPACIESGTRIESDAVILGPVLIGKNARIGHNACIEQAVLWENADIGPNCLIRRSLIDSERKIPGKVAVDGKLISQYQHPVRNFLDSLRLRIKHPLRIASKGQSALLGQLLQKPQFKWSIICLTFLTIGILLFSYFRPTVIQLWHIWMESDEYSSGLLVPFLAGYVLWIRREEFLSCSLKPAWAGLGLLVGAQAFRIFGLYFMFASAERIAFVISIGAIVLLIFGWKFFLRFLPVFIFLFLMLPLPNRVEASLTLPLQNWATISAVFSLETLGYNVIRQGNIIQIGDTMVAVAEACNGLRMLTAFFVISGFVVLISNRKRWEKGILLVSAIPIALACNTLRLTLTSIAFTIVKTDTLESFFHDFGGLLMMPLAIGIVLFELWLLTRLFNQPEHIEHQVVFSRNNR